MPPHHISSVFKTINSPDKPEAPLSAWASNSDAIWLSSCQATILSPTIRFCAPLQSQHVSNWATNWLISGANSSHWKTSVIISLNARDQNNSTVKWNWPTETETDRQTYTGKRIKEGKRKSYLHFKHCNPGTIKNKYLWATQQKQKRRKSFRCARGGLGITHWFMSI